MSSCFLDKTVTQSSECLYENVLAIIKHIFEPSQHTKEQARILDFKEIGGKGSE